MPQVQVVDLGRDQSGEKGIMGFLNELGNRYKEGKDKKTFENLLGEYEKNIEDENAFEQLYVKTMKSDMAPSAQLQAFDKLDKMQNAIGKNRESFAKKVTAANKVVEDAEKKQKAEAESYELLIANGVPKDKAKELSKVITPANAKTYGKQKEGGDKLDKFDQKLQQKGAEEYIKLQDAIPRGKDALANLDHLESLSENELSGLKGYAKSALNTESAAEFSNLAFTSIEPIIKLFNPVGPIPVGKMKMIQNTFQMHPGELKTTIRGKIASLRRIGQQGLARNEQRAALLKKHKGLIPEEELKQFDKQTEELQDALVDNEAFQLKISDKKDDEMVEGFYSKEGKKLKPMAKKKAVELFNQGLITNVPPE